MEAWSTENVMEFLDYYEKEPVIWDASLESHKNRNEVFSAWRRIELELGEKYSISELKKKKDSLMASFRTCYNKVKQSIKSGASADDIYKPNWFAYEKMHGFLKNKEQLWGTINLEDILYQEEIINEEMEEEGAADNNSEITEPTEKDTENEGDAVVLPSTSNSSHKSPLNKRKKISEEDELKTKLNYAYNVLRSNVNKSAKEKDIYGIFGDLVAEKLRRMEEHSGEIAMNRIDNLLFEMKMNRYLPSNNYHQSNPQKNVSILSSRCSQRNLKRQLTEKNS